MRIPGDKSITHRALMLSAMAGGESRLRGLLAGEDCQSTATVLRALGATIPEIPKDGSEVRVEGAGMAGLRSPTSLLDCGNSGTTARLLLGVLSGLSLEAEVTGDDSLRSRPMRRVTEPLGEMGASFEEVGEPNRLPLRAKGGPLSSISYPSPVASGQVKGAILLAGLCGAVDVTVVEPSRSRDHTERMLRRMGVPVREAVSAQGWEVSLSPIAGELMPLDLTVPGDFSSAAFLIALGLLRGGSDALRIDNVGLNPTRTGLLDLFREMGGRIEVQNLREGDDPSGEPVGDLTVFPSGLRGVAVRGSQIPLIIDEIPILAVTAALATGATEIRNAEELRVKESDRIRALAHNLATIGVSVEEYDDGLRIEGQGGRLSGHVSSWKDHRVAMAFGVLGALPDHDVSVDEPEVVDVSFPGFWEMVAGKAASVAPDRED